MNTTKTSEESATAQAMKVLYTAKAHTTGGREGGASRTSDGRLDVKLSVPGGPGEGTNPEQLFAVGWSACFLSAIKLVAGKMKVKLPAEVAVDPEVDLCASADGSLAPSASQRQLAGRGSASRTVNPGYRRTNVPLFQSNTRQHQGRG